MPLPYSLNTDSSVFLLELAAGNEKISYVVCWLTTRQATNYENEQPQFTDIYRKRSVLNLILILSWARFICHIYLSVQSPKLARLCWRLWIIAMTLSMSHVFGIIAIKSKKLELVNIDSDFHALRSTVKTGQMDSVSTYETCWKWISINIPTCPQTLENIQYASLSQI